ncbi:IclR family transcriptional regulator C-terminal domain-containing protein [Thermopolyspora sp. NPDC052614]|uniref:IclR family transcriptional regulator domain-containing protein n=1 Tax=Thermopolyspora sp. NPDC052614 TaxID=3155682 RepID=UPI003418D610
MTAPERSRDLIQSLERGVAVMKAFSARGVPMTISEIAAEIGLSRPVVRRILLTLEHLGYARQTRGVWTLTPRVLELSSGYFVRGSLGEISRPFLEPLAEQLGETCAVTVLDGTEVIHVALVEFRRVLPEPMRVGAPLPVHATAFGKVLLAGLAPDELEAYLAHAPFEAYTDVTPTDASALRSLIDQARRDHYYIAKEELFPGTLAIAVPITAQGEIIGALGSTSSMYRSSVERLREETLPVLQRTAADIAGSYEAANRHRMSGAPWYPNGRLRA